MVGETKLKREEITTDILEILHIEPVSDIDFTIEKLEAIKSLLNPKNSNEEYCAFDNLIEAAKETKLCTDHMKKIKVEKEDDFEDYIDDDYPRSKFDDDGNEIFFSDDENQIV